MFLALDQEPTGLRPATSGIAPNDWQVLSRFWYPVAVEGDLKQAPVKGDLLDVDLVIYRAEGKIAVAVDRCPHRHVRLSAGEIVDDRLVCPYHGLAFNAAGHCTAVPSLGHGAKVPSNYRVRTFRSQVRYGLVWACLDDDSKESIPTFRAGDEVGPDRLSYSIVRDWPASAARQMENFLDVGHIPFVHAATLGGDTYAVLQRPKLERTNEGFTSTTTYQTSTHENLWTFNVKMPFMIEFYMQVVNTPAPYFRMAFIPAPINAEKSRMFLIRATDEPSESKESREDAFADKVNFEDIGILAEIAEPNLPLDEKHEVHLPIDNVNLEYRRHLRDLGLGRR